MLGTPCTMARIFLGQLPEIPGAGRYFGGLRRCQVLDSCYKFTTGKRNKQKLPQKIRIFRIKKGIQIKTSKSKRSPFWGCCSMVVCALWCCIVFSTNIVCTTHSVARCGAVPHCRGVVQCRAPRCAARRSAVWFIGAQRLLIIPWARRRTRTSTTPFVFPPGATIIPPWGLPLSPCPAGDPR